MTSDTKYMREALRQARRGIGRTTPNPPVGAVLVRDDKVIGRGFHPRAGEAHAEIFALRDAGYEACGATLYVTLEPCSHQGRTGPCADALIAAGVSRVLIGCQDPNPRVAGRGIDRLRAAGIEVETGILADECRRLLLSFAKLVTTGSPYVIVKSALTLDGKIATSSGDSRWVSNAKSRLFVHRLRDQCDAIMVGSGTVLHDNPLLNVRGIRGGRDPLRVIVDSRLRTPADALVISQNSTAGVLIATTSAAPVDKVRQLKALGVDVAILTACQGRVDLPALLCLLGQRGVMSLLVEGGRTLNSALLAENLIDRLLLFIAPKIIGGDGPGLFAGAGKELMADAIALRHVRTRRFGTDILVDGELTSCLPD
ncbi:MAG: bifunctional diaminohydroxyphosphoribosylaminopyrimidine deaminase/5-amino-6-(5-phosphoribosylamino)uracil reductase RibD [Desulfuromonadaceae bacterium]|nr:bifunctional diaminohydroxyphosphoribosylaminopyrimidine deaminase/5-amino-6-(5-phosphoribosylamino)uracil reductase RibD [Desulfuromonadaceae bacterium]